MIEECPQCKTEIPYTGDPQYVNRPGCGSMVFRYTWEMCEMPHPHNCVSCRGNNQHYEPTWALPVYCLTQKKHISNDEEKEIRKNGCDVWTGKVPK